MAVRVGRKNIRNSSVKPEQNNRVFNPVTKPSSIRSITKEIELSSDDKASLVNVSRAKKNSGAVPLEQLLEYIDHVTFIIEELKARNKYLEGYIKDVESSIPEGIKFTKLEFTGEVNGINNTFTIINTDYTDIYVIADGGKLFEITGYTVSGNDVIITDPPNSLEIWGNIPEEELKFQKITFTGAIDGSNDTFVIDEPFQDLMVIADGGMVFITIGYTLTGNTLKILTPPDTLEIWGNK